MKNLYFILAPIILFALLSCEENSPTPPLAETEPVQPDSTRINRINTYKNYIDSLNETLEWKELKCGLWLSNNSMLALKSQQATSETIFTDRYITKCGEQNLIDLIDTNSFSYVGSTFYTDRNHVYSHYATSDGGFFRIVENADVESFEVLRGDHYGKDKHHIYDGRNLVLNHVDHTTFRTLKEPGFLAKDKNGYYQWGEKVELDDIDDYPPGIRKKLIEL